MKNNIDKIINSLNKNIAPNDNEYSALLSKIDFKIDSDFLEFIKKYNGAEGEIGDLNYINFWDVQTIINQNPYFKDEEEKTSEKFFFFAGDGGDYGYAFNKDDGTIIGINYLDIGYEPPKIIAKSFKEFLDKLSKSDSRFPY
jgi:hypothetical protein